MRRRQVHSIDQCCKSEEGLLPKRRIVLGVRARLPVERIIRPPRSRAHGSKALTTVFSSSLSSGMVRNSTRFIGSTCCSCPFGVAVLHHGSPGPLFITQSSAEVGVEFGPEARGEEAVAVEPARRVDDEDVELRLRDREAVRARRSRRGSRPRCRRPRCCPPSLPFGLPRQSLIGAAVLVALRRRDRPSRHRICAGRRPRAAPSRGPAGTRRCRIVRRGEPLVDEVVEARELAQPDLAAELVEARHAVLAVADDVERRHVERGVEARTDVEVLQELRMIAAAAAGRAAGAPSRPPSSKARPGASAVSPWRGTCRSPARASRSRSALESSRNSIMSGTSGCSR